jgi:PAS domain S-box-containing protein
MSQPGAKKRSGAGDEASDAIEARLRLIIDTIPAIVWRKSPDGSADFLNRKFREYTGLSLEEGLGWGWMKPFHPDDRRVEEWRADLAAGKPFEKEARLRRADGQYRWFLLRAEPQLDEQGNVVKWFGTSSDIDDLKRAEDRARLIINTIPMMAWTVRPDGVVDFLNQRWLDYAGLSFADYIEDPKDVIHPDDLPRVMKKWVANMAAGDSFEEEMRLRRADGEYRWFLVRTDPLRDEQGNIVKWYGVSIDMEDRKRAESQSLTLLDAIPQQIWSGPPDGTLDYCNERWRSYMGIGLTELQGEGWQRMLHPDDRNRVLTAWRKSVTQGTPYEQEERHRGVGGTYRWFLSRGLPYRDAAGRIVRWYGTNTDIQDRKQAEQELQRLSGQLLRLQEEERRRIARDLHDSTGQDLVALATTLSQLHASVPTSNRKLRKLASQSQALVDQCIREVRTLSYLLYPPMLDESGLEDAIRHYMGGFTERTGIDAELEISPGLGRLKPQVELALFRIVQESLTNIQRHSGSSQAKIRIEREAGKITLEINDKGSGISGTLQNGKLPFGSGVGIPSMHERATQIGGQLAIESSKRGTTVRVTIATDE